MQSVQVAFDQFWGKMRQQRQERPMLAALLGAEPKLALTFPADQNCRTTVVALCHRLGPFPVGTSAYVKPEMGQNGTESHTKWLVQSVDSAGCYDLGKS